MLFKNKKIICAGMNLVTSIELAKRVFDAGGIPSMLMLNMGEFPEIPLKALKDYSNSNDYIIGVSNIDFRRNRIDALISHAPSHIELLDVPRAEMLNLIIELKNAGIKIIQKYLNQDLNTVPNLRLLDGVSLKLAGGSGRAPIYETNLDSIKAFLDSNPNIGIIFGGGLYDNTEIDVIKNLIPNAYYALGIRFALSAESTLSESKKLEIISNKDNISRMPMNNNQYERSMIIFKNCPIDPNDNNTLSLQKGLYETNNPGIVYAGKSLARVSKIETVKDIIDSIVL